MSTTTKPQTMTTTMKPQLTIVHASGLVADVVSSCAVSHGQGTVAVNGLADDGTHLSKGCPDESVLSPNADRPGSDPVMRIDPKWTAHGGTDPGDGRRAQHGDGGANRGTCNAWSKPYAGSLVSTPIDREVGARRLGLGATESGLSESTYKRRVSRWGPRGRKQTRADMERQLRKDVSRLEAETRDAFSGTEGDIHDRQVAPQDGQLERF